MSTFTGFCQETSGLGTIWIESFEAGNEDAAMVAAQKLCAEAWGCELGDVHVLGLAAGNVEILHWGDLNDN